MRRALALCLLPLACATPEAASPPLDPGPPLLEPTEHLPAPDFADLPRDLKTLGSIVPRWTVEGGPRAALGAQVTVHVRPEAGQMLGLDNANGKARWQVAVAPAPLATPVRIGAHVFLAEQGGLLASNSETGAPVWRQPGVYADVRAGEADLFTLRVPVGGQPEVAALDPSTGQPRWARPCRPGCRLLDARGGRLLVAPAPGRLLVVEGGEITLTAADLRGVRSAQLVPEGLLVATSTAVVVRDAEGVRLSSPQPGLRAARRAGPQLLADVGQALLGLDPKTGAERWRVRLAEELQGQLRVDLARHLPEGQLLVPSEDLFGAAPVYLLIRDDGTLRIVRYGHPGLANIQTSGPLALFASERGLVLSGTRRRGAPIRHYQTPAQDVAAQLTALSAPAAGRAGHDAHLAARTWLTRLGRPVYAQALHAKIAAAPPERLAGLLFTLDPEHPEDREVARQALWRLTVAEGAATVDHARAEALARVPGPWSPALWGRLVREAPRWLAQVPRLGWTTGAETPAPWLAEDVPGTPAAMAQLRAQAARIALGAVVERAPAAGYTEALWDQLDPAVHDLRARAPCPWPEALQGGPWPVPPRCPLDAPPLGAVLSEDHTVAAWRAGAAGDPGQVWVMRRDGAGWGPARISGVSGAGRLRVARAGARIVLDVGALQHRLRPRALDADRDGDGLTDLFEAQIGTHPRKQDTDGDGLADARDGSPSCPSQRPADPKARLRGAVAQTVAALTPGIGPWRDGSRACLGIGLASGPLIRRPQGGLSRELIVDELEGPDRASALKTAEVSGQLPGGAGPAALTSVIRWRRATPESGTRGATWVFVMRAGGWRRVAIVDELRGAGPRNP